MKLEKQTRVYVAGCGGMLGEAVYELFSREARVMATDIDVNEQWLTYADVRDHGQIAAGLRDFRPHLIVNLAAMTDLECCEEDSERAWLTNALGAENLGLLANELDVPYVLISTAGIFDGRESREYTEFDAPNPIGTYARSKAWAESWTLATVRRPYVIRAGWMMGGGPVKDKKFINKLWKQLQAGAKELSVVGDKLGTPTYTVDFARGVARIVESGLYGLYNQVCGGSGSRYDVAIAFIEELGLKGTIKVTKVPSEHFRADYFAPRPPNEKLCNFKLDARGLNVMRNWRVCLADYAKRFKLR